MIVLGSFTCLLALAFLLAFASLLDERRDRARADERARRAEVEVEGLRKRVLSRSTVFDQLKDERWSA